ncbi:MAG: Rieske 2Fe-2S domain-containing protein [Gammaproteobacteria bacterium]|nr:Rieske 2Fe-2S domain-containing protein [Gammaproteobacteria bacterium]
MSILTGKGTCMPGVNIQDLVGGHVAGHTLQQPFYCDPDVFSLDRERVLDRLWHLAGHVSRIPAAGDYFLFRICGEEIIIVRGRDGNIHAHYNVCRHRGSRVCPDYGLHACRIKVLDGLIFVSLAGEPAGLDEMIRDCRNYLSFHGIENAKIARRLELPTRANWKLVVENFIECYHCIPAHPEYCSVHSELKLLAAGAGVGTGPEAACLDYAVELNAWKKQVEALGHPCQEGEFDHGAGMVRMPIKEGFLTESQDGRPVSTLMGKFREYDGGVTYVAFNYLNYLLASNDHAVILRFTPISELVTDVEAIWLVDADAREGVDYVPERVSWVWDVTLKQDAVITENNQAGILSSHYQPGPYSEQEVMNCEFTRWYLDKLSEPA